MKNVIQIKKGFERRIKQGHLWIFSNELINIPKLPAGSIVDVLDSSGFNYGKAFYNPNSLIAGRLLKCEEFDSNTLKSRLTEAIKLRAITIPNEECVRICFGESDLLPGLIIDKYGDYLSIQILSAGFELLKEQLIITLMELLPSTLGIIEKSTSIWRSNEGLEEIEQVVYGSIPENFDVVENGINLSLSLHHGQKTGYFLDQKINRFELRKYSKGKRVLDCFCNQGGFALNASIAGAIETVGVDSSLEAIDRANRNSELNNFKNISFIKADVFDYLDGIISKSEKFDLIILDPPSFAKNKKSIPVAIKGYGKLNRLALKALKSGGYLVSSSCSQHISEEVFLELISNAASKENLQLQIVFRGGQSPDHPILASMPETNYLKFFIFAVK